MARTKQTARKDTGGKAPKKTSSTKKKAAGAKRTVQPGWKAFKNAKVKKLRKQLKEKYVGEALKTELKKLRMEAKRAWDHKAREGEDRIKNVTNGQKEKYIAMEEFKEKKKSALKKAGLGKKPDTAYFLFLKDYRKEKAKDAKYKAMTLPQRSRLAGEAWNALSAAKKAEYEEEYEKHHAEYKAKLDKVKVLKEKRPRSRPMSAYNFFIQERRTGEKGDLATVGPKLGKEWKKIVAANGAEYQRFADLAAKDKEAHPSKAKPRAEPKKKKTPSAGEKKKTPKKRGPKKGKKTPSPKA